ncbi:hypothetical protein DFH07DRAFT_798457 [Mycena maculata]|uniref:Hydrophobin n=1 Tax=Mycena maculata TaxID=230809 RepID=A0AAD7K3U2_9AGAR|nr:hypothetical protein DFH07DRAFT_798457 [Mycena maculata]
MYLTQVLVAFVLAIAGSASPCSGQAGGSTNACVRQPGYDGKSVVSIDRSTSIDERVVPNLPLTNIDQPSNIGEGSAGERNAGANGEEIHRCCGKTLTICDQKHDGED